MEILRAYYTFYREAWRCWFGGAAAPACVSRDRLLLLILVNVVLVCSLSQSAFSQRVYDEYEVKAAFIYNCLLFVDWPEDEKPNPDEAHSIKNTEPFTICVLGEDPFGKFLDAIAETKTVKNRPIKIKRIKTFEEYSFSHILFISKNMQRDLKKVLDKVSTGPVLTIADFGEFADRGGILEFILLNNRVNFRVNKKFANQANLRFSAQLLSLAVEIIRDPNAESASND